MALTKTEKQKILEELKEKFERQKSIVFADFTGLKVKDLVALRKKMKKSQGELKVAKKTMISLILKEKKINFDAKKLKGEIVLGFGYQDEVSPFKILYNFSKESKERENLKILGGFIGENFYEKEKAIELGQLPSKEELVAKLFFNTKYPLFGLFNILQRSLNILNPVRNPIKGWSSNRVKVKG